ncbi:uncharacterized protein K452DRAFT_229302 [Aplosporella prunicola CBS 121167]|uniref:F-box domain-containing protein n=1 Tax=Aplosporella prunicola CBS 121167 TaxID=1176127 RepID=A0A6A6BC40_9PEZI|nr:uncharacterized protein K452DRAFT_229302 [Aplosporella prunicola CBS 121167]KAF2140943.1 hypothetical protein K452DRAFT_229302 [Aplosporella prunicola CBS 121167]
MKPPHEEPVLPPFLSLPAELIQQTFGYLEALDLARISQTCRLLHQHGKEERLWKPLVQAETPGADFERYPPSSWRETYATHHPHWFLTRGKLWFSDAVHTGKLLLARYNPKTEAIEAHSITAERGPHGFELWEWNLEVIIHRFAPKVQLDHTGPVLKLDRAAYARAVGDGNRLQQEIMMDVHNNHASHGLYSMFMLARPCPAQIISPGTRVWPPLTIPAAERTRNESINRYRGTGHKPSALPEVSNETFRLRKWMEFSQQPAGISMRVGEDVTTFASLDKALYTPTPAKPWRGVWCGDYAGHGCEFLLVLQPDAPRALPEGAVRALARRSSSVSSADSWLSAQSHVALAPDEELVDAAMELAGGDGGGVDGSSTGTVGADANTDANAYVSAGANAGTNAGADAESQEKEERDIYAGQIEAIKLTGDPNIPRGEHTFIAPDIGPGGLVRVATEEMFRGARVVRSVGHIAARGFREDEFIPSQLIMISPDRLAQYWAPFGHISFYQRVDLGALLSS